jgi:hypothetical protein
VNALPPCGSYAGVHSETDGRIGTGKSAGTISKVLKINLTVTAFTLFFQKHIKTQTLSVILSELGES